MSNDYRRTIRGSLQRLDKRCEHAQVPEPEKCLSYVISFQANVS